MVWSLWFFQVLVVTAILTYLQWQLVFGPLDLGLVVWIAVFMWAVVWGMCVVDQNFSRRTLDPGLGEAPAATSERRSESEGAPALTRQVGMKNPTVSPLVQGGNKSGFHPVIPSEPEANRGISLWISLWTLT